MHTVSAAKFLMWFFGIFAYLVVVVSFAAKFGDTPISKREQRKKQDIFFQGLLFLPIFAVLAYVSLKSKASVQDYLYFLIPVVFVVGDEYLFNRPRLKALIIEAQDLFKRIKLDNQDVKYSYAHETAEILLNNDMPAYIKGNVYDVRVDRVCKNQYGEYFWIRASVRGFFEPAVKHLTIHGAKNLLRNDRDVFMREFNEEPYINAAPGAARLVGISLRCI
jgi:sarcosine oxidase delta subunit